MHILTVADEREKYQTRLNAYRGVVTRALPEDDERRPLLADPQVQDPPGDTPPPERTEEEIYREYEGVTTTIREIENEAGSCPPCKHYRRKKLLEAAERLKTALLQELLLKMLTEFNINRNTVDILKEEHAISLWKEIATHFIWGTILLYGAFKGYSALAGILSIVITSSKSIALILPSAITAAIFTLMLLAFEGQEVRKSQGLTGSQRSTRIQMGEQYKLATTMAHQITTLSQEHNNDDAKIARLERYHTVLTQIHEIDLNSKIKVASTYANQSNNSKVRKVVETGVGGTLSLLNGASFGFVGLSTVALIAKCSLAALLSAAMLSTPAGIAALVSFSLLCLAGIAVGWIVKKLGPNLMNALNKKAVYIEIEKKEKSLSLNSQLESNAGFFNSRKDNQRLQGENVALREALRKLQAPGMQKVA